MSKISILMSLLFSTCLFAQPGFSIFNPGIGKYYEGYIITLNGGKKVGEIQHRKRYHQHSVTFRDSSGQVNAYKADQILGYYYNKTYYEQTQLPGIDTVLLLAQSIRTDSFRLNKYYISADKMQLPTYIFTSADTIIKWEPEVELPYELQQLNTGVYPGYIITDKGDTLKGSIDYRNVNASERKVVFDTGNESVKYIPQDILGYCVGNYHFKSKHFQLKPKFYLEIIPGVFSLYAHHYQRLLPGTILFGMHGPKYSNGKVYELFIDHNAKHARMNFHEALRNNTWVLKVKMQELINPFHEVKDAAKLEILVRINNYYRCRRE